MKKLTTISLRLWLPVFVITAFILMLTASSLWRNWHETQEAEQRAVAELRFIIADAEYRLEQLLRLNAQALVVEEVAQLGARPEIDFVALVKANTHILYSSQPVLIGQSLNISEVGFDAARIRSAEYEQRLDIQFDASRDFLLVYAPVTMPVSAGKVRSTEVGILLVKYSLSAINAQVKQDVLKDFLINLGITLVIALSLIFCVRLWFARPLLALQNAVIRMAQGDFDAEINLVGKGELAELGKNIEQMQAARKQAEMALLQSESRFHDVFKLMPASVTLQNEAGVLVDCSDEFCELTGYNREEAIGRNILDLNIWAEPELRAAMRATLERDGHVEGIEFVIKNRSGATTPMQMSAHYVMIGADRLLLTFALDISSRKQVELAFAHQAELLKLTGKLAQVGGWEVNLQTMKLTWTQETFRIAEIETGVEPVLEEGINLFAPEARPIIAAAVQTTIETGVAYDLELPLITAKGRHIWVKTQGFADIQQGKAVRIYGTFQDVTASRQVNIELTAAVQEKTVLLKEVHHRVKNNLQVITSLLSLEATRSHDFAITAVLKEMKGRIRSMALLHDTLYRTGIFAGVDLSRYLKQLASEAFRATASSTSAVSLELELASVHVEMDQALPCGLLVNELLSNCLKHGFPNGGKGVIRVELKRVEALVHLSVSDTGIGLASDFNLQQQTSLGLHLVADLAQQLGGELQINTGLGVTSAGAIFTVVFTPKT